MNGLKSYNNSKFILVLLIDIQKNMQSIDVIIKVFPQVLALKITYKKRIFAHLKFLIENLLKYFG